MKILVAEDEKPLANAIRAKLSSLGHEVEVAPDGAKAIEMLTSNNYDVLILDIVMPEKTGFDVLEELKSKGIQIKTIVTSNLSQPEDQEKAKKLGAVDYFVKSNVSISELMEKIQKLL